MTNALKPRPPGYTFRFDPGSGDFFYHNPAIPGSIFDPSTGKVVVLQGDKLTQWFKDHSQGAAPTKDLYALAALVGGGVFSAVGGVAAGGEAAAGTAAGGAAAGAGETAAAGGAAGGAASKLATAGSKLLKGAEAVSVGALFANIGLWKGIGLVLAGAVLILIGILNLAGVDPSSTARRVVRV